MAVNKDFLLSVLAGFLAAVSFSMIGLLVIELDENYNYNAFEVASMRGLVQLILNFLYDIIYSLFIKKEKTLYIAKLYYYNLVKGQEISNNQTSKSQTTSAINASNKNTTETGLASSPLAGSLATEETPLTSETTQLQSQNDDKVTLLSSVNEDLAEEAVDITEDVDVDVDYRSEKVVNISVYLIKWLFFTSIVSSLELTLLYYTYIHLEYGNAVTVLSSYVILTYIVGYFVLKEKISTKEIVAVFVVMLGIFFIAQPSFVFGSSDDSDDSDIADESEAVELLFYLLVLFCSVLDASRTVFTRKMRIGNPIINKWFFSKYVDLININYVYIQSLWMFIFGTVFSYIIYGNYFNEVGSISNEYNSGNVAAIYLEFILVGLLGMGGIILLNYSILTLKSGFAGVLRSLDISFCYILEVFILDEAVNQWSLIGAILIVSSILGLIAVNHVLANERLMSMARSARNSISSLFEWRATFDKNNNLGNLGNLGNLNNNNNNDSDNKEDDSHGFSTAPLLNKQSRRLTI